MDEHILQELKENNARILELLQEIMDRLERLETRTDIDTVTIASFDGEIHADTVHVEGDVDEVDGNEIIIEGGVDEVHGDDITIESDVDTV
ncbi:MAG TPA: hypothetical protein GXZ82_05115, partial [Firmicutes bacterium]|nr:hypothetical protein [Bacillota bacterium]